MARDSQESGSPRKGCYNASGFVTARGRLESELPPPSGGKSCVPTLVRDEGRPLGCPAFRASNLSA